MGKDLKGKDIGRGYSQRKDGYYIARVQYDGHEFNKIKENSQGKNGRL